jgi:glycerophosphoryl diester phosphodiesterase
MTRQIEIIGHRGARGLFPENSIEGFRQCLDLGVRAFELDVGMTADGVVVVSHDLALNPAITRDAAGNWLNGDAPLLGQLPFDVLRSYDVGRIRPATPYRLLHRRQRGQDGIHIPSLEEVLLLSSEACLIIELKTDPRQPGCTAAPAAMAEAVLAVVDRIGAAGRVIIESFDWRGPHHVRRIRPDVKTAWLTRSETVLDAALWWDGITPADFANSVAATVAAQGGQIWATGFGTVSRATVAEAHDLGLQVIPWTVNRRKALRRMFDCGVDAVITDRPDVAFSVLAERGCWSDQREPAG